MTEEQIERRVEHMFDSMDKALLGGSITQAVYDAQAKWIDEWSRREMAIRERTIS